MYQGVDPNPGNVNCTNFEDNPSCDNHPNWAAFGGGLAGFGVVVALTIAYCCRNQIRSKCGTAEAAAPAESAQPLMAGTAEQEVSAAPKGWRALLCRRPARPAAQQPEQPEA